MSSGARRTPAIEGYSTLDLLPRASLRPSKVQVGQQIGEDVSRMSASHDLNGSTRLRAIVSYNKGGTNNRFEEK
jgi:hypothetical protein